MISEQDVKDVISSVLWNARETQRRLALDEVMTGSRGTSSESWKVSGKIEACKEISLKLGVNLPSLYQTL